MSPGADRRRYKNPPIVEAVCSFRFVHEAAWNGTIPGLLYAKLKEAYPDDPELRQTFQAEVVSGAPTLMGQQSSATVLRNGPRILSISPEILSVHSLAPYEGWESLEKRSEAAFDAYCAVAHIASVERIGVRYINRVSIPGATMQFSDYFTVFQALPAQGFSGTINSFFDRIELIYDDVPASITFTWASVEPDDAGSNAFVLDFDLQWGERSELDQAMSCLNTMHDRVELAFESIIGDKLRENFGAHD